MKEPYVEGVATHDDPESCAVIRYDAGQGEHGGAKRAPDAEPVWRAQCARPCARSRTLRRPYPRQEPSAVVLLARICAGGGPSQRRGPSLPRSPPRPVVTHASKFDL